MRNQKKHCYILNFLPVSWLRVVLVLALSWMFSVAVFANTQVNQVDVENSFFSFESLLNIAYGLTGIYDNFDNRDSISNLNNQQDSLVILGVNFKNHSSARDTLSSLGNIMDNYLSDADIIPAVLNKPLVYPNPFRQSSSSGAVLSYELSKDMDVEIHIYDMMAQRVFKQTFLKGTNGARQDQNNLRINQDSMGGYHLASGVYFYLIIHADNVLAKGKMVVKP